MLSVRTWTSRALVAGLLAGIAGIPATQPAAAEPTRSEVRVAARISLPGAQPLALAVYETGDRLFVADDNSGRLLVYDASTYARIGSVEVGGAVFALVVDESQGKVYAASDRECCTTGLNPGTGLVTIVDARTLAVVARIDPGPQGNRSAFVLVGDEARDKVYVGFYSGIGVIDAASDAYTSLLVDELDVFLWDSAVLNPRTGKAFLPHYRDNRIFVVDGATNAIETIELDPTGAFGILDIAVNEVENKLYLTMLRVPGQGPIGILVLDLDTGGHRFFGRDDLEPLVFNPRTNRLFVGVQVGERGGILDEATDRFTPIALGDGGFGTGAVRQATDNAYFASQTHTFAVSGTGRCSEGVSAGVPERGGLVASAIAVNERTGRVFVSNDDQAGRIMVIQDAPLGCARACVVPNVRGKTLAAARTAIRKANCTVGTVRRAHSATVARGRVSSQRPAPRARLGARGKVNLVVSLGRR